MHQADRKTNKKKSVPLPPPRHLEACKGAKEHGRNLNQGREWLVHKRVITGGMGL